MKHVSTLKRNITSQEASLVTQVLQFQSQYSLLLFYYQIHGPFRSFHTLPFRRLWQTPIGLTTALWVPHGTIQIFHWSVQFFITMWKEKHHNPLGKVFHYLIKILRFVPSLIWYFTFTYLYTSVLSATTSLQVYVT